MNTISASQGRWREILASLGVAAALLNGKQQPCPMCGGVDRFQFTDRNGDGDYICRGCGAGKGVGFLMKFHGWDAAKAMSEVDKVIGNLPVEKYVPKSKPYTSPDAMNALWQSGQTVNLADPVGIYFGRRGIVTNGEQLKNALRYVPNLPHHRSGCCYPGMLALIRDEHGNARQLQRTYLTQLGLKADVEPNRMFMPGQMPIGGAIRLGAAAEVMGIAEGVETALAAAQLFQMPVWATTSEMMLRKWEAPLIVKRIEIFGDNDANFVGQSAAYELAKRLKHEGKQVVVRIPEAEGQDWNDQLEQGNERVA